jgi:hypothetical protein
MNNQSAPYVITKFDRVNIITEESPRAAELLAEYGIHCVGCFFSENDTLETGGQMHGLTDSEVDEMIDEINTQLEKEWMEEFKSQKSKVKSSGQKSKI